MYISLTRNILESTCGISRLCEPLTMVARSPGICWRSGMPCSGGRAAINQSLQLGTGRRRVRSEGFGSWATDSLVCLGSTWGVPRTTVWCFLRAGEGWRLGIFECSKVGKIAILLVKRPGLARNQNVIKCQPRFPWSCHGRTYWM